jgi:SnoaL-like domain
MGMPARQRSDSGRGPDAAIRFFKDIDETMEELRLKPQEFIDAGDRVATRLRHHGRGKGRPRRRPLGSVCPDTRR